MATAPKPHESRQRVDTYADLLRIPEDGKRREILEGVLEVVPSPYRRHQLGLLNLCEKVRAHVRRRKLGEVIIAPFDVVFGPTNVLVPDLIFVSKRNMKVLTEKNISGGVPDLVVEFVSEGSGTRDRVRKRRLYERFGVPHYWIFDPKERCVEELVLEGGRYVQRSVLGEKETFSPLLFPGLKIDLKKIWRD